VRADKGHQQVQRCRPCAQLEIWGTALQNVSSRGKLVKQGMQGSLFKYFSATLSMQVVSRQRPCKAEVHSALLVWHSLVHRARCNIGGVQNILCHNLTWLFCTQQEGDCLAEHNHLFGWRPRAPAPFGVPAGSQRCTRLAAMAPAAADWVTVPQKLLCSFHCC
jgi:hypothetical protein